MSTDNHLRAADSLIADVQDKPWSALLERHQETIAAYGKRDTSVDPPPNTYRTPRYEWERWTPKVEGMRKWD